jgi:hypothetical protein
MVMFKHGVAYLERSGPCDGAFELSFKRDEMNDVLKSLAVWVARGEAKVGALAFEKPEDPETVLQGRGLDFDATTTLAALLAATRGRRVQVDAASEIVAGEVLGVEETTGAEGAKVRGLVLRTSEGRVALVDLARVRGVELLEEASRADLAFFVDRRRAATSGENRTVRVAVTGRAEDLRVSYVVPAPTWRVSYRIAREAGAEATTRVMAWGIVHNPADEDLDDIDLTLTTGQPVSFTIDLYNPKNVERAVVEETSRAVAAPTTFERAPRMAKMSMAAPAPAMAAPPGFGPPGAPMAQGAVGGGFAAPMLEAAEGAATYEDRGELFEYRVASKVSLKRGSSAMVPLLACKIAAKKERIWRDGAGLTPDLVMTFANDTGAVLEEGPAVIYDEDVYAGEAMVPYSARGAEVKLAFAKDLGVRCRRATTYHTFVEGVRVAKEFLAEEQRREERHELTAESDHAEEIEVVFELGKTYGRSIDPKHAQPFEETASYRRFRAKVPPRGKATLTVVEQWHDARRVEYSKLVPSSLAAWVEGRFMDRAMFDALSGVLAAWEEAAQLDAKRARWEKEQQEAYAKQTKVAEQLKVLKDGGPEGALRLRYVKELEAEQDKVNACEKEIRTLRDGAEAARKRAAERLAKITG